MTTEGILSEIEISDMPRDESLELRVMFDRQFTSFASLLIIDEFC